jgi:tRNA threonylcarbamoyladenosine biosynthesis protein TsaB
MTLILCIETATPVCSVAIARGEKVIAKKETQQKNTHSSILTLFIRDLLMENNFSPGDLNAVAVSKGPGSYTGLRIGVSTAKGFCYGLDIPLISVNTLQSMASGMSGEMEHNPDYILYCPMIDARRMEVYSALFDSTGNQVRKTLAEVITPESFRRFLNDHKVLFFGDGAAKCKEVIQHPNAVFNNDFLPSASHMASIAASRLLESKFENVAYFEPFYLKDFIAGVPKVKGL